MSRTQSLPTDVVPSADATEALAATSAIGSTWKRLYTLGGVAALMIAVLLLGEMVVYAALPRPRTGIEHCALFRANWLAGLLTLDRLGMLAYLLFVPTIQPFCPARI
jgi:hypothetical protein